MNGRNHFRALLLIAWCSSWRIIGPLPALAFAAPAAPDAPTAGGASSSPLASVSPATTPIISTLDPELAARRIRSGRVYVHPKFLSKNQLRLLQLDMKRLESDGKFVVNGLSDVRKGLKGETSSSSSLLSNDAKQAFSNKYDRSVCPIPWWRDALSLPTGDTDACSLDYYADDEKVLHSIQTKLQRLRRDLSGLLDRPSMMSNDLGHECYYSQSAPGSSLARHMDERHEETKGTRGWLLPSRRSLSWLVYISEKDGDEDAATSNDDSASEDGAWDDQINGGLLRTFPQKQYRSTSHDWAWEETVECGSHDGNLQIGWLDVGDGERATTYPVFLDSWFDHVNPYTGAEEPHCILYFVRRSSKEYISRPWSIDAVGGGNVAVFIQEHARLESISYDDESSVSLFLQSDYARQFQLLEDRDAWMRGEIPAGSIAEDYVPTRGTLVVFDSVTLPHEVTAVVKGRRAALAGWFHEETQPLGGNIP
mmetsp:Transcript_47868/g.101707  ORF Transcript_47868/g.101707 Transcript_47868/m.101707 type:complete len:480 (+) Transcript_47868:112-1551(+)|eukprot:CAMPEP_0172542014 /NCGR_PEP_ID=MMETSP1067-20121228/12708_1 /TAXON_ID=265564 ORGANISM="Thalassiosira punctigera, Strain Tpunct2005C2" /NCGR_SAMPLE_ID=MMETSP1067 /ASSEMBLY_ACC=CAM_ASM_000444 /LENGTH=479 /DNA_ID=CAMNT_0013328167 /DNA_START=99 /DNA_END=1538 /DNA_ORIENTATION=+